MKIINSVLSKRSRLMGLLLILTSLGLLLFTQGYDASKDEMVVISTEYGDITVGLYKETPLHREVFLNLVKDSYSDSLLFHQVIKGFVVKDDALGAKGVQLVSTFCNLKSENSRPADRNLSQPNQKKALDKIRVDAQNSTEKAKVKSEFYIVQGIEKDEHNLFISKRKMMNRQEGLVNSNSQIPTRLSDGKALQLDGDYTVFGEVVNGMEIIDQIAFQPMYTGDRAEKDIKMSMKIIKQRWP